MPRTLVSIPLGAGTPTAGTATTVAIPGPADCTVDYRPFAIRVHRGKIYIGVTCGSGTEANLKGYVYEYNGSTFTTVLTIPFTYPRADDGVNESNSSDANYYGFNTYQWQYTAPGSATSTVVQNSSANSYIATQAGEYRVVILDDAGSSCPDNSCCPLIIVERQSRYP